MHMRWNWLVLLLAISLPILGSAAEDPTTADEPELEAPREAEDLTEADVPAEATEPAAAEEASEPAEASPSTADPVVLTKKEQKRQERMDKLFDRTMTRYNLPIGQENLAHDVLVRQAVYTRRTGRRLVASGSIFVGTGSLLIGGGLLGIASGDIGAALVGLAAGVGGIAFEIVGITQLTVGLPLREGAKGRLRDLGVDPKIPTKEALVLSVMTMLSGDRKGVQLALRF